MAVLALDLATVTGWALDSDTGLLSGVWDLSAGRGRPYRARWLNLWERLNAFGEAHDITTIVFEEVLAHPRPARVVDGKHKAGGTNIYAAHLYGSLKGAVEGWAETRGAQTARVNVATAKKLATGRGNANKAAMKAAAERKWPDQRVRDDNQADALHILEAFRVAHGGGTGTRRACGSAGGGRIVTTKQERHDPCDIRKGKGVVTSEMVERAKALRERDECEFRLHSCVIVARCTADSARAHWALRDSEAYDE